MGVRFISMRTHKAYVYILSDVKSVQHVCFLLSSIWPHSQQVYLLLLLFFFTLHICAISFIVIYVFRLFYGCIFQQHVKNTKKEQKVSTKTIFITHMRVRFATNFSLQTRTHTHSKFSQMNLHGNLTACLNDDIVNSEHRAVFLGVVSANEFHLNTRQTVLK